MKTKITKIATLFAILAIVFSCTEDMEYKDVKVSPVNQLYEPVNEKSVELVPSATASLFFEWETAKAEDSGSPLYEVVFDKEGGDFSNPIYTVLADNNGSRNYATISHKTLNKIGAAIGLNGGETGTVIWSVIASRGLNSVISKASNKLTITRLLGFAEVPTQLYLTGEATEGGNDISKAVACSSPEQEVFEIFTQLKGGKTYKLVDSNSSDAKTFYIDGNKILEGEGETTVAEDGIYRIVMDFSIASVSFQKIESVGLWFCPSNKVQFTLDYKGNGVFEGTDLIKFKSESWGQDGRYKFRIRYSDKEMYWGTLNDTDVEPNGAGADSPYYFIKEYGTEEDPEPQWNHKWKFDHVFDGKNTKVTLKFNGGNYTHFVELAGGDTPVEPETAPDRLFLTGEASEGGNDLSKAVEYTKLDNGKFEIFTKLVEGKTYKLASSKDADAKYFYIDNNEVKSGDGSTTASKDGVYRISIDFSDKSVTTREVKSMGLWNCWDRVIMFDLPYTSNGVFEGTGLVKFNDNRYKFQMEYANGDKHFWGVCNDTDYPPGANPDPSFFYLREVTSTDTWDDKFKFNDEFNNNMTKISVFLNGEHYTHSLELAN